MPRTDTCSSPASAGSRPNSRNSMECFAGGISRSVCRMARTRLHPEHRVIDMPADVQHSPDLVEAFERLTGAFCRKGGLSLEERCDALKSLRGSLIDRREDYVQAIDADFRGRSRHETLITEVAVVISAIDHTLSHLQKWAAVRKSRLGFPFWPASGEVRPQPRRSAKAPE